MKLPKAFIDALERGLCAAPAKAGWRNMMVGDWAFPDGGCAWATPYPEHMGHWHTVEATEPPVKVGGSWVFFGVQPDGPVQPHELGKLLDHVEIIFTDVRECPVDVAAWLETFHMYRRTL